MRRAVAALALRGHVLVDGNRLPDFSGLMQVESAEAIIKGDSKEPAISAASILAKTLRDRGMVRLARRYPNHGFEIHKGYPTPAHLAALREHGVTAEHRLSFGPVKSLLS